MGWPNAILLASQLIELTTLARSAIHNCANACLIRRAVDGVLATQRLTVDLRYSTGENRSQRRVASGAMEAERPK
jgi:hypothetical protein